MRSEYRVLTPESVEFAYELAGLGTRMLAVLIDTLLLVAAYLGLQLLLLPVRAFSLVSFGLGSVLAEMISFTVLFGYFALQEWRLNGQTVGKRLLDLRVIDERGFSIDLFQAVIRNLLRLADLLPFFYAVGGATALLNARQKRLGDFAAGTLVVRVRQRVMPGEIIAPQDRYNSLQEDPGLRTRIRSQLSLPERDLLLQLCLRRHELALEPRQRLFGEASSFLEQRLETAREPFMSPEKFVQNIAAIALAESPARGLRRATP